MLPNLQQESILWQAGYKHVIGIDEVGRGAWAGPLVAAGVIFPINYSLPTTIKESKQLKPRDREKLEKVIKKDAVSYCIYQVSHLVIDRIGIAKATQIAFRKIISTSKPRPDFCLVDAFHIKYLKNMKQESIIHGDMMCTSIAAASVIAKVYRDKLMQNMSNRYPNYGFEKHKGYGTKEHQLEIKTYGLSNFHRSSYSLSFLFK